MMKTMTSSDSRSRELDGSVELAVPVAGRLCRRSVTGRGSTTCRTFIPTSDQHRATRTRLRAPLSTCLTTVASHHTRVWLALVALYRAHATPIETHSRQIGSINLWEHEGGIGSAWQIVKRPTSELPKVCYYLFDTRHSHARAALPLDSLQPVNESDPTLLTSLEQPRAADVNVPL